MPVKIDGQINEGESAWIDVASSDVDGDSVTPTAMWWWWTDSGGNIINSRNKVAVDGSDLGTTTQVELTPSDTVLSTNADTTRVFTVKYTYTSDRGSGKTKTEAGEVDIIALRMIPDISPSASLSPSESPSESPSLSPSESPSESPSISPSA